MSLGKLFTTIFVSLLLSGNVFAEGSKFDRFATDVETTAQLRDDVGLTPASIHYIMAAPGTVSEFKLDHNVEILNADRTILITDKPIQWLDANGADRNVTLPAEASSTDLVFTFYNDSDGGGENLVIRDDTPTTLITLGPGQGARVSCDGTSWKTPNAKGIYYDGINDEIGFNRAKIGTAISPNGTHLLTVGNPDAHSYIQIGKCNSYIKCYSPNHKTQRLLKSQFPEIHQIKQILNLIDKDKKVKKNFFQILIDLVLADCLLNKFKK